MTKRVSWMRMPSNTFCEVLVEATDSCGQAILGGIQSVKSLSRKKLKVDVCDDRRHVLVTPLVNEAARVRFSVETASGHSAVARVQIDPV